MAKPDEVKEALESENALKVLSERSHEKACEDYEAHRKNLEVIKQVCLNNGQEEIAISIGMAMLTFKRVDPRLHNYEFPEEERKCHGK